MLAVRVVRFFKSWWGPFVYLFALMCMFVGQDARLTRENLSIDGPEGRPCTGTLWTGRDVLKAVIVIGHGVTSNQGMMASIAKAYADAGYAAVAIDFWGHGTSRERFDWQSNAGVVKTWCAWAAQRYPSLPVAYLGHSMGGFAGTEAFAELPPVGAFISLGALPRKFPPVKTLVAMGKYEELFSPETAQEKAKGNAQVLISPYSDHALEPLDPALIMGMISWSDYALGRLPAPPFQWMRWWLTLAGVVLGCIGAFGTASRLASLVAAPVRETSAPVPTRTWSVNPYRLAGRLLRKRGYGAPPMATNLTRSLLSAVVFAGITAVLLAYLLNTSVFTSLPTHPARCVAWLVLALIFCGPFLVDAFALERLAHESARGRFLVAALTRGVPLLFLCITLQMAGHGIAFGGMMLGILAFVATMISIVYTLATRAANDYIAGAVASSIALAWVFAFWFPLTW